MKAYQAAVGVVLRPRRLGPSFRQATTAWRGAGRNRLPLAEPKPRSPPGTERPAVALSPGDPFPRAIAVEKEVPCPSDAWHLCPILAGFPCRPEPAGCAWAEPASHLVPEGVPSC